MARQAQTKSKAALASTQKKSTVRTSAKQNKSSQASSTRKPATGSKSGKGSEEHGSALEKLFVDMLKDMYWAEQHLVPALTEMQDAATTPALQDAFEDHIYATKKHAARLEKAFRMLGKEPQAKKCDAMEGLTKEAKSILQETQEGSMTRDAGLIIAAQKVEHYEIATYGSLVQLARTMDREDVARILEKTLWEEEDTDLLLTDIAESDVNPLADDEEAEEEDENEDEESDSTGMLQFAGGDSLGNL